MKKILAILLIMGMILGLGGCVKNEEEPTPQLVVGVMGSVDALPLAVAEEMGMFSSNGVNVKLEVFKAAKDRDAALEAGLLDGVICDEIAIAIYNNAGIEMKIVSVTDGRFTLVAGKDTDIESISDFAGKKVAISENTVIEFTLDKLSKDGGIEGQIEKVIVPPMPSRMEMLNQGQIEGALLPQPFSDIAISEGGREISKVDSTGQYISVIAFSKDALADKKVSINNFLKSYDEAADFINNSSRSECEETLVNFVGYPENIASIVILPFFRASMLPPTSDIEEVFQWAREKGLLTIELSAKDVLQTLD